MSTLFRSFPFWKQNGPSENFVYKKLYDMDIGCMVQEGIIRYRTL